ncbi:hypothetical protein Taro_051322 [Colocasia esculenta]|uniref:CRIB domain-containing protein n=1 Tax=Colocasia esculenta TaxID=4460 RepID=A0A843XGF3_COLES|nr:hypothetical protein [Colocasia esculenta]
MATKMKGFFKGFKYISQIFVYKEHEMEIGYPTDVRHVAHIGWDSSPLNAPSWMNEFKTASDFSATSLSSFGQSRETSWASQGQEMLPMPPKPNPPVNSSLGPHMHEVLLRHGPSRVRFSAADVPHFDQARGLQATTTATIADPGPRPPADIPKAPKKTKRKKAKQQSPSSRSSSRSSKSRATSFATAHGDDSELRGESG